MNYYRYFAARALSDGLKSPYIYLMALLFSLIGAVLAHNLSGAVLPPATLEFISMALVFNVLGFLGYASIFGYAQRVFFREKKAGSLVVTLCSPAGLNEIFWGKVAGVVAGGFVLPVAAMLASAAVFAPRGLLLLASWKTAAALLIVLVGQIIFAAVNGMFMLSIKEERGIALLLYLFGGAQVMLTAMTRTAAGQEMFRGPLFQYSVITAGVGLFAAAAYFSYFSKIKVVESA